MRGRRLFAAASRAYNGGSPRGGARTPGTGHHALGEPNMNFG